jgi:predicted nucleotidyltransferase
MSMRNQEMSVTPYSELNQVLADLVSRIQEILGDNFVGAYLQGSFAVGDFDLDSDVDFTVVIDEELSGDQIDALQVMHDQIYQLDSKWAQHLEGSYFPREILRHHSRRGSQLWYLDNGARSLIRSDHCNTIVVRWVVREKGVILAGPAPNELVDPISDELLKADVYETLTEWGQEILDDPARYNNRFYQGFIVLSYCRMLHDLHTGNVGSKQQGADWAKATLDPSWSDLIDGAWATRPIPEQKVRQPADPLTYDRTLKFVETVMNESSLYKTYK